MARKRGHAVRRQGCRQVKVKVKVRAIAREPCGVCLYSVCVWTKPPFLFVCFGFGGSGDREDGKRFSVRRRRGEGSGIVRSYRHSPL